MPPTMEPNIMPIIPTVPCTRPYSCGASPRPPLWGASIRNRGLTLESKASGKRKSTMKHKASTMSGLRINVRNVRAQPLNMELALTMGRLLSSRAWGKA